MLITGGLLLHVIVLSMFLRPKSSKVAIHTNNHAENNSASKEFEKPLQTIKKEQLKYVDKFIHGSRKVLLMQM
jgi:hypothetical protein